MEDSDQCNKTGEEEITFNRDGKTHRIVECPGDFSKSFLGQCYLGGMDVKDGEWKKERGRCDNHKREFCNQILL